MKEINVGLYGGDNLFSKRGSTRISALITSCSRCDECQIYKEGKCVLATRLGRGKCLNGSNRVIEGPTSRAQSYSKFKSTYKNNPLYDKLECSKEYIFTVGEDIVIQLPDYTIGLYKGTKDDPDKIWFCGNITSSFVDLSHSTKIYQIKKEQLTTQLLYDIFTADPRAWFSYEPIKSYKTEFIRDFQIQLMKRLPDIFNKFIEVYPQFNTEVNYVGKEAFVRSLKNQVITIKNVDWQWDQKQNTLSCITPDKIGPSGIFNKLNGVGWEEIVQLVLTPTQDFKIVITDNKQVDAETEFDEYF